MSNKYKVWDWVVTKSGQVRQITHDDMNDLHYSEILRKASPSEVEAHKKEGHEVMTPYNVLRWTKEQMEEFERMKTLKEQLPAKDAVEWIATILSHYHHVLSHERIAEGQEILRLVGWSVDVGDGYCPYCGNSANTFGNNCNERCLTIRNHK